jgi:division protein CdvB (Snf7/Vps24/ESCRT-III family)
MSFLFGGARTTSDNPLRALQSQVRSSVRTGDRELARLDRDEKVLLAQLKKCSSSQHIETARIKAKELVRLRAHRLRLTGLKAGLSGLSQQLGEVGASHKIQEALAKTTVMLQKLNGQLSLGGTQRMVKEFDRQTSAMSAKQEFVNDALDSAFEGDNEEVETESAVLQVLEEAGLDEACRMQRMRASGDQAGAQDVSLNSLEARLNSLRPA